MPPLMLTVELVPLVFHTDQRAVALLQGDAKLTAAQAFNEVADTPVGKRFRHKMGLWIASKPDTEGKFHRFKNAEVKYKDCFVFLDIDAQLRLYGFTCHPQTNKRFELVVLTNSATKKESLTDKPQLDRVLMWQNHMSTKVALMQKYPNTKDENKP